jgi:hypothetical protein
VALVLAGGLAACTSPPSANDEDRHRVEVMKAETVVASSAGASRLGAADGGDYAPNSYSANPVDKRSVATPALARTAAAGLVNDLRTQGWTVVSARCSVSPYTWETFAYRVRDQVPYGIDLKATYSADSGLTVTAFLTAPFHADKRSRFQPAPAALAAGSTCLDKGSVDAPEPAQGTVWDIG